jgi:hypothetical protein
LPKVQTTRGWPNRKTQTNDHEKRNDPDVPSRKVVENCSIPSAQHRSRLYRPEDAPDYEYADDYFRDNGNVDAKRAVKTGICGFYRKVRERRLHMNMCLLFVFYFFVEKG